MKSILLPSFQLVSLQTAIERTENGLKSINEIWKIFSTATSSISSMTNLSRLNIHQYEIPNSTSSQALDKLLDYYSQSSKDQVLYHENLRNQIVKTLEESKSHLYFQVEQQKLLIRNASKKASTAQEGLEKSKRQMHKATEDMRSAKDKLLNLSIMAEDTLKYHGDKNDSSTNEKESMSIKYLAIFLISNCFFDLS